MPIYEYQCDQCGHQFDTIQKFSDAPLERCPECDELALRKKISAPSFRLSGSGWYETDFKSDNEKKRNLAGDQGVASKSSGEGASQTNTQADTKAVAEKQPPKKNSTGAANKAV